MLGNGKIEVRNERKEHESERATIEGFVLFLRNWD
jgi:hypothetical protein